MTGTLGSVTDSRTRDAPESDPNVAVGGFEVGRDDAGGAVRRDPLHVHVAQRLEGRLAQPVVHPYRIAGDLQGGQGDIAAGAGRRMVVVVDLPLHDERQLWIGL